VGQAVAPASSHSTTARPPRSGPSQPKPDSLQCMPPPARSGSIAAGSDPSSRPARMAARFGRVPGWRSARSIPSTTASAAAREPAGGSANARDWASPPKRQSRRNASPFLQPGWLLPLDPRHERPGASAVPNWPDPGNGPDRRRRVRRWERARGGPAAAGNPTSARSGTDVHPRGGNEAAFRDIRAWGLAGETACPTKPSVRSEELFSRKCGKSVCGDE